MATTRIGQAYGDKLVILGILVAIVSSIFYQGSILRSEIRDLRTEIRAEIGGLRGEFGGLHASVGRLEVAVARIEARRSLRRLCEGTNYGGPMTAACLLLARALPEFNNATLSALDMEAQSKLAEDLWEDRANILARANPLP